MPKPSHVLIAIAAVTAVPAARADCIYPPEVGIPDGGTATELQMKEANQAVKEYMAKVEEYLGCLDEDEKKLGDAVTEEQKAVHTSRHNAAVDALNAVAARYNEQVQVFKKRGK